MVLDLNLAVAHEGNIGETALTPGPLRGDIHLLQINLLGIVIAGKDIVKSERAVLEEVIELLCHYRNGCQGQREEE